MLQRFRRLSIAVFVSAAGLTVMLWLTSGQAWASLVPEPAASFAPTVTPPGSVPARPFAPGARATRVTTAAVRMVSTAGQDQGDCAATPCRTVQYAVDQAAAGDEVRIATGVYTGVQARSNITQVVLISTSITLTGGWDQTYSEQRPHDWPTVLDAGRAGRVLVISGTIIPTLSGLRVTGGTGFDYGGGIYATGPDGRVTIGDCMVYGNDAAYGGGIYLAGNRALLRGNQVMTNTATWQGGGIFLYASPASLVDNQVAGNQARLAGGGLYVWQSPASVTGGSLTGNQASRGDGGGAYWMSSSGGMTGTLVSENQAYAGGGLYLNGSGTELSQNRVISNSAGIDGGGVYLAFADGLITGNTVDGNQAPSGTGRGGGIYAAGGRPVLTGNRVLSNSAGYGAGFYLERGIYNARANQLEHNIAATAGGGIYLNGAGEGGPATLADNVLSLNEAGNSGGGALLYSPIAITVTGNSFLTNTAQTTGGGLSLSGGRLVLTRNNFAGNQSAGYGAGLYLAGTDATTVRLAYNRVTLNSAELAGGGMYLNGIMARLDATTVLNNEARGASGAGGGIYLLGGRVALSNTIIADNLAGGFGSGIYADGTGYSLAQTTLARNAGASGSGLYLAQHSSAPQASAILTNTVVAGQSVGIYAGSQASARLAGTLWGTGAWADGSDFSGNVTHTNDTSGDPAFVAPDAGDYHLGQTSAAIDRGLDAGVATDIDGQPRPNPVTGIPDLGADEWYGSTSWIYLPLLRR
jgi:hypothetical protein